jgi:hypothetical protein
LGVSGVPQLFGERVIVAGAGAATVFTCEVAGRAMTLAAIKSELKKDMDASLRVSAPIHSSLRAKPIGFPCLDANIAYQG